MYPFAVHARPARPGPARRRGVERNGVAKLAHQQRAGGPPPARRASPVPCSCGRPPTVTPPALQAALPGRQEPCCVFSREYTAEIGQAVRSPAHMPRCAATTFTRDGSLTCRRSKNWQPTQWLPRGCTVTGMKVRQTYVEAVRGAARCSSSIRGRAPACGHSPRRARERARKVASKARPRARRARERAGDHPSVRVRERAGERTHLRVGEPTSPNSESRAEHFYRDEDGEPT